MNTVAFPSCEVHPPFSAWPINNLITGVCPACAATVKGEPGLVRELRARRLVENREREDA